MDNVAFRGDWFDAGIGVDALDIEREAASIEVVHALAFDEEARRIAARLWSSVTDGLRAWGSGRRRWGPGSRAG